MDELDIQPGRIGADLVTAAPMRHRHVAAHVHPEVFSLVDEAQTGFLQDALRSGVLGVHDADDGAQPQGLETEAQRSLRALGRQAPAPSATGSAGSPPPPRRSRGDIAGRSNRVTRRWLSTRQSSAARQWCAARPPTSPVHAPPNAGAARRPTVRLASGLADRAAGSSGESRPASGCGATAQRHAR